MNILILYLKVNTKSFAKLRQSFNFSQSFSIMVHKGSNFIHLAGSRQAHRQTGLKISWQKYWHKPGTDIKMFCYVYFCSSRREPLQFVALLILECCLVFFFFFQNYVFFLFIIQLCITVHFFDLLVASLKNRWLQLNF